MLIRGAILLGRDRQAGGRFYLKGRSAMFGLDKALKAPGEIAKQAARTAAQLPTVPLDVADQARQGLEEGIEKVTSVGDQRRS